MLSVDQVLQGMNMHALAQVKSAHFHAKIVVLVLITSALVALSLLLPTPFWILPSLLLGFPYAHAVELEHQCLHSTAYATRIWNRIVGVTLSLPTFVSYSDYQNSHLKHHRRLGTQEDKECFNYSYQKLNSIRALIPHLWMVRHYRDVAGFIVSSVFGKLVREKEATPKMAAKIRTEYQIMGAFVAVMAVVTVVFQTTLFLKLWFIPFLIAVPLHALIELPEQIGCNTKLPNVLVNTRTIKTSKIVSWFVDGNNFHVEHHWLPGVPNDRFAMLHERVVGKIEYLDSSYWSFYKQFFTNLRINNLHRPWEPQQQVAMKAKGAGA